MKYKEKFELWKTFDEESLLYNELMMDEKEIEDRFYKELDFGTGGLRGIMGIGTNRMNIFTVRKATYGFSMYLKEKYPNDRSVVIAYDSRNNSRKFAEEVASTLCACNIRVKFFNELIPTPVLSFAVRDLNCSAGIMITASHNPKEYNGYKVYDNNGCQIVPRIADEISKYIQTVIKYDQIPHMNLDLAIELGLFKIVSDQVMISFLEAVKIQTFYSESTDLKVVYSPLHGTGNIPVRNALKGFNVFIVEEQEHPDGDFPTIRTPNPEEHDTLKLALIKAEQVDADVVLATDPDCDRVGVAVKHNYEYRMLTGNQIGALLTEFVLSHRENNSNDTLIKSIVTNELGAKIAQKYGVGVVDTLTGFKYIGEQISTFEENRTRNFVIGYEESYGYLVGTHSRDKDAVVASKLICEMTAYYKSKNMSLIDAINELYQRYGYYLDKLDSFTYNGRDGLVKIKEIMDVFRSSGNELITGIMEVKDYYKGIDGLPLENVLKFILDNGSWFAIRPSGTEPKIKIYYSIRNSEYDKAVEQLTDLQETLGRFMK